MIWIVLILAVLCITMSCLALRYREKWQDCKRSSVSKFDYDMLCHKKKILRDELQQVVDLCELLKKLNAECSDVKLKLLDEQSKLLDENIKLVNENIKLVNENIKLVNENIGLLIEVKQLRSQLPKRDSKGRFCKRKEE